MNMQVLLRKRYLNTVFLKRNMDSADDITLYHTRVTGMAHPKEHLKINRATVECCYQHRRWWQLKYLLVRGYNIGQYVFGLLEVCAIGHSHHHPSPFQCIPLCPVYHMLIKQVSIRNNHYGPL